MSGKVRKLSPAPSPGTAGGGLRDQVEAVGTALAETFSALLGSLPGRPAGPQALSNLLGITVVTASRLLRAIAQANPIAVVEQIPGTLPLRQTLAAVAAQGAPGERIKKAEAAVDAFDELIRKNAAHRSSLNAMLTDWLPQGRREFESRRRQAAFKAISELKGVRCELDLATIALHPAEQEGRIDLLSIQGSFGLDRIRPDSIVQFGTLRRSASSASDQDLPTPFNLEGQPASEGPLWSEGLHSVRLDQFCSSAPAPIEAHRFDRDIQYTLGQTGFGPDSSVDLVMAEVNRGELETSSYELTGFSPYFFQMPAAPSREMLFDLLIHRDVFPGGEPELLVYDTSLRGPARAGAPEREVDLMRTTEELQVLGERPSRRRFAGFPRYLELLDHAFERLGWPADEFSAYRVHVNYPLHATQTCIVVRSPGQDS